MATEANSPLGHIDGVNSARGIRLYDENDPVSLLLGERELIFPDTGTHHVWFIQKFGSHLLDSFFKWEENIEKNIEGDDDLQEGLKVAQADSNSTTISAELMRKIVLATSHFGSSGMSAVAKFALFEKEDEVLVDQYLHWKNPFAHSFKSELWMNEISWSLDSLPQAYKAWTGYILNPKKWIETERRTGIPCMLELPEAVRGLPKAINLGGMLFELRFERFYVPIPTVKQHPYAMRFFDHMGANYEEVSDLDFKSRVFRQFNNLLTNEDLRIRRQRRLNFSTYSPTAGNHLFTKPTQVLDIGCGTGLFLEQVSPEFELIGVDVSGKMCDVARGKISRDGRKYKQVIQADAANISELEDQSVDLAMMSFVEIWMDRKIFIASMKEAKRVLRSDGALVFNLHNPYPGQIEQMTDWLQNYCGFREVTHKMMVGKQEDAASGYGDVRMVVVYK